MKSKKQDNCIFCQIAEKKEKSYIIWESKTHLAFLSIFPNMKGVTVVIPKKHFESYAFKMSDKELGELIKAAKYVAVNILDKNLESVGRTGLVLEGFGINHVHAKLFPLPNTSRYKKEWKPIKSSVNFYFTEYPGYICSNDSARASDEELQKLTSLLKN